MKIRTHFKHNVFMLNEAGVLLFYEVALRRWPEARI